MERSRREISWNPDQLKDVEIEIEIESFLAFNDPRGVLKGVKSLSSI